ncbi:glycosyltransferase family 4 protein [Herbaspirillum chlorophenolicum]|uniref:Glycosyltransferase family 4 protein n=1 Tax=Herbaspirillum chlorophenolicum TaxID=211589 RepID=A0ABW8ESL6_9BURK
MSQYFWPENFRINELSAELVRRGHEVTVLTGLPNYPDGKVFAEYRDNPSAFCAYQGVQVVRVPLLPRGKGAARLLLNYASFVLSACLLGAWRLRGKSFDVVFTFEPSPIFVGIPAALMRFLKGAPHALWVLDLWPDTLKAVGILKSDRLLAGVGAVVRWIYRRCDLILAQSRSFVEHIRRYAPTRTPVEYFPAWADDVFADGAAVMAAPEVPLAPQCFTVLFAGNIGEAQDFPAILDAAERLRERTDIRWIIVGDGRVANWVRVQIEQRGLAACVQMAGRHPLDRMPSFFAHADALLVSLRDEPIFSMTIPGKLQAYLGAGIPVLAMLDGEGARIVEEADAGLVCAAGDGSGLAANVARLAKVSVGERRRLGDNGRRFCHGEFDRMVLMDRLETMFRELAVRHTGNRRKR